MTTTTKLQPSQEITFSFDPWLKANLNFGEPDEHVYRNGRLARQGSVVCKHWLKGTLPPLPTSYNQGYVKKAMPVNSYTNTISAKCRNVTFLPTPKIRVDY